MFTDPNFTQKSIISIVGAGGKTTLMFLLARMLPFPCLVTTTTKVGYDQIMQADLCLRYSDFSDCPEKLAGKKVIWVSPEFSPEERKVAGFSPELFREFTARAGALNLPVVIEADGAHMRHIKSPADHESVIPAASTIVMHLTGLDVLGKPVTDENVHRLEQFQKITGADRDDRIDEDLVVKNILHPVGGFKNAPDGCIRIAVLTHADTPEREAKGRRIAEKLLRSGRLDCVWLAHLTPISQPAVTIIRADSVCSYIFDSEPEK